MSRRSLLRLGIICNILLITSVIAFYVWYIPKNSYALSRGFPSQYFAPDVNVTLAGDPFADGQVISQARKTAGAKYYQLSFVTAPKGRCQASWNATQPLGYMSSEIDALRAGGGDIIPSFGGYIAGNPTDPMVNPQGQEELALTCPTAASLQAQYQSVIDTYHATHINLAIEGDALSSPKYEASIAMRDQALLGLHAGVSGAKLCIEFTLPGTPAGLTNSGQILLKDAMDKGVNVCVVNILAMNYGSTIPVTQPGMMGQYAIGAARGLFGELMFLYPRKSVSQLWSMIGVTIMNGVNDQSGQGGREITRLDDVQTLLQFAMMNKIRELSLWELHRDLPPKGNPFSPTDTVTPTPLADSGITQKPFEFSTALNTFTLSLNCPGQSTLPNPSAAGTAPANDLSIAPANGSGVSPTEAAVPSANDTGASASDSAVPSIGNTEISSQPNNSQTMPASQSGMTATSKTITPTPTATTLSPSSLLQLVSQSQISYTAPSIPNDANNDCYVVPTPKAVPTRIIGTPPPAAGSPVTVPIGTPPNSAPNPGGGTSPGGVTTPSIPVTVPLADCTVDTPNNGSQQSSATNGGTAMSSSSPQGTANSNAYPSGLTTATNSQATASSPMSLTIRKSKSVVQVGQEVTYQLSVCNAQQTGNQLLVVSDILSAGLTAVESDSPDWEMLALSSSPTGPTGLLAIYLGPPATAPNKALPPLILKGRVTVAAVPLLTSFGLAGIVDPNSLSGETTLGVSNVTGWAAAIDALVVLPLNR